MTTLGSSGRWLLHRFALAAGVVVGVATLTFALIHLAPGDPIYVLAGDGGSPDYYADMRAKYGLDRPIVEQFGRYAKAVAVADFGYSFMYQAPVVRVLLQHAPASLLLGFSALLLATCAGFTIGMVSGTRPNGPFDTLTRALASVIYSAPVFWTGQMLIILVAVKLRLLPAGGFTSARDDLHGLQYAIDVGRHLVLPAVTLSLPFMAVVARVTRAAIAEALREPFVLAATARGLSRFSRAAEGSSSQRGAISTRHLRASKKPSASMRGATIPSSTRAPSSPSAAPSDGRSSVARPVPASPMRSRASSASERRSGPSRHAASSLAWVAVPVPRVR